VKSIGDITTEANVVMSNNAAAITHTGASLTVSSDAKVLIESVTFIAGAVSTVTSIGMSDDITMSKGISKITHSGTGGSDKLHIESSSKPVQIEGVTFTGSIITGAGAITSNGALTIGGALSGVTSLAASGATTLTANTGSTSKTSGTLIVTGGVGVSGQVSSNTNKVFASTGSSATNNGALIVVGGVGVGGQVTAQTVKSIAGLIVGTTLAASGATTLTANTASSTKTSGTLIVTGGVGVSGQVTADTLLAIGTITSNDFFKTNNDKGIRVGAMSEVTMSGDCAGTGAKSATIDKWHGRIKLPTGTCNIANGADIDITVTWSGTVPTSFQQSTFLFTQCGTSETNVQGLTHVISITAANTLVLTIANPTAVQRSAKGNIYCYVILWGQ